MEGSIKRNKSIKLKVVNYVSQQFISNLNKTLNKHYGFRLLKN